MFRVGSNMHLEADPDEWILAGAVGNSMMGIEHCRMTIRRICAVEPDRSHVRAARSR
jgi:hypothetical protein